MRKKNDGEARESRLASGWTVEGAEPQGDAATPAVLSETPTSTGDASGAGVTANAATNDTVADVAADEAAGAELERSQMSNAMLVVLGVFGGIYLMYAWVWLSWADFYAGASSAAAASSGTLGGILQQAAFWAAPLAPIGWFLSAMLLNRGKKSWKLVTWIVIGAVVLVPLPMFVGGA